MSTKESGIEMINLQKGKIQLANTKAAEPEQLPIFLNKYINTYLTAVDFFCELKILV